MKKNQVQKNNNVVKMQPAKTFIKSEPIEVGLDPHVTQRLLELDADELRIDATFQSLEERKAQLGVERQSIARVKEELIRFDLRKSGAHTDYSTQIEISQDKRVVRVLLPPVAVQKEI